MTRTEAAKLIATAIEAADYTTSEWTPEGDNGPVRIYVTIPAASWKKKSQKIGYVEINKAGEIVENLDKQKGAVMGLIPELTIEAVEVRQSVPVADRSESKDEIEAAFEASDRSVAAAELAREQG